MYGYLQDKTRVLTAFLIILTLFVKCNKTTEKAIIKKFPDKPAVSGTTRLGIIMLKSKTLDAKQVKKVTLKLYKRLLSMKGEKYIAFKEYRGSNLEVNHCLTGSVDRLKYGYSISVLVRSRLNGNTVYKRSSRVNEEIELDYILNDIAERVVEKLW
jgi:hypothetical protein